ncbi:MAG: dipicolinate synthase subunit B [Lachnospiraceae bacterium]|nr:dipicolinate synthase subunit B [Lachnospiraceae bacterium]
MKLSECNIGFAITGSFCTFDKILPQIKILKDEGARVLPILSFNSYGMDTRFFKSEDFVSSVEEITGEKIIKTVQGAEPIGPKKMFDIMIIAPCTGNTIAKLSNGIVDTPVLMAAKAHLRNNRPLVLSVSSNDALGINFQNIGKLMNMKNIYFVPFGQDDYVGKPNSLIGDINKIKDTLEYALDGQQIQPVII